MLKSFLAGTCLILLGFFASAKDEPKTVKIKTSAICEMCKARIEKNLGFSKGVKDANLDLTDKVVTVTYDPSKTDEEKIKETIAKTGYDANDVTADPKGYDKLPSCCKKDSKMKHQ
ncbi:MAG: heavy metal-associated domain-containing protein [Siphonobacter sp.]